jgi:hypothetical protein
MFGDLKMNNQDIVMSLALSGDSNEIRWRTQGGQFNRIITIGNGNLVLYGENDSFFAVAETSVYTNRILNMGNNRIINLLPAIDPNDAVTLSQLNEISSNPVYRRAFSLPSPDAGETYKRFTRGAVPQLLFTMTSPSITASRVKFNIDLPPLPFRDELVNFEMRIYENTLLKKTIPVNGTYQSFTGKSNFTTQPEITSGVYSVDTASPFNMTIEIFCIPEGVPGNTTELLLNSTSVVRMLDCIFSVEPILLSP